MKKFNECFTGEKRVKGIGSYLSSNNDIYIETKDSIITDFFTQFILNKKHINLIEFSGLESDGTFNGPFMVVNIDKSITNQLTTIHLRRSV